MAGPFNFFSQVISVTAFGVRSVPERKGSVAASVFGTAGVVAVLVSVLSIAKGFQAAMTRSGDPSVALVMRSGSDSEMMSILIGDEIRMISELPGIARSPEGPLASAELFVVIDRPKRSTGTDANVPLRGVQRAAPEVRKDFRILEGRMFEMGRNEVIVGRGAAHEFAGLDLGASIKIGRNEWTIVGIFSANGGIAESEIWTDAAVLQAGYQRGNSFQSVYVKLSSPEGFQSFEDAITTDPRFNVKVIRQTEYYEEQSELITNMITGLGTLIASLMGIGAAFGALNTMYTAVSARTREIATLRALGFGSATVVISVLIESLALAALGGGIGSGLSYLVFDGFRTATLNWQSFSQVTFAFDVTPGLLAQGVVCAIAIGSVGGLFPAIRAARLPIAAALREL